MAERTDEVSVALSGEAADWLRREAAERDVDREALVERLLLAHRSAVRDGEDPVADLRDDVDAAVSDLRERVLQVKRAVDAAAPADHDHADLAERTGRAAEAAGRAESRAKTAEEGVEDLRAHTEAGFENYEEVLDFLTEAVDDLEGKTGTLARALVETREAVESLRSAAARRAAVDRLRERAQRCGVRTARCADCGAEVDVALLTEPACPYCDAAVGGVEPGEGFLGSATLRTGDRPAPDAPGTDATVDADEDLEDVTDADGRD